MADAEPAKSERQDAEMETGAEDVKPEDVEPKPEVEGDALSGSAAGEEADGAVQEDMGEYDGEQEEVELDFEAEEVEFVEEEAEFEEEEAEFVEEVAEITEVPTPTGSEGVPKTPTTPKKKSAIQRRREQLERAAAAQSAPASIEGYAKEARAAGKPEAGAASAGVRRAPTRPKPAAVKVVGTQRPVPSKKKVERYVVSKKTKRQRGGMSAARRELAAYEFLCHQAEAKQWIEDVIGDKIRLKKMSLFADYLRDGYCLARLGVALCPDVSQRWRIVPRRRGEKLDFRFTENINTFYKACKHVDFPKFYLFTVPDLMDKKNPIRVVFCLHALAHYLVIQGIGETHEIQNMVGTIEFDQEEITETAGQLEELEASQGTTTEGFGSVREKMEEEKRLKEEAELAERAKAEAAAVEEAEAERARVEREEEEKRKEEEEKKREEEERQEAVRVVEEKSATKIQSFFKARKAREEFREQKKSAVKVQALVRGHRARQEFQKQKAAAVKVQAFQRGHAARKEFLAQKQAVVKLQAFQRGQAARKEFLKQKSAATKLQALQRGRVARKEFRQQKEAATKVQAFVRASQARREFQKQKAAAVKIQALVRGRVGRKEFAEAKEAKRLQDEKEQAAAIMIQKVFRGHTSRVAEAERRRKEDEALRESAATKIQALFRGHRARVYSRKKRERALKRKLRREQERFEEINRQVEKGSFQPDELVESGGMPVIQKLLRIEADADQTDWLEIISRLKKQTVVQVRTNYALEKEVDELDKKIELTIRNRKLVEERKAKKPAKKPGGEEGEDEKPLILSDADVRKGYQQLFYVLQAQPEYLAECVYRVEQAEAGPFLDAMILSLFGFLFSPREEYLILRLLLLAAQREIKSNKNIRAFLEEDTVITRMIVTYTKRNLGREALKTILAPVVGPFLELKLSQLEVSPLRIYHQMINEMETTTGEKSSMERNASIEDALILVRPQVNERMEIIVKHCRIFLDHIFDSIEDLPYGLRYICKQIEVIAEGTFGKDSVDFEKDLCPVLGYFIYYRFLNPAICSPVDVLPGQMIKPNDIKNLLVIGKVLQNLFNFRLFPEEWWKPVNDFIESSKPRVYDFLRKVIDVRDASEHLKVDQYVELTETIKPVILISLREIFLVQKVVTKYKDDLAHVIGKTKAENVLGPLIDALPDVPDLGTNSPYLTQDVQLTLLNPAPPRAEKLMGKKKEGRLEQTKKVLVDVLRALPPSEAADTSLATLLELGKEHAKEVGDQELRHKIKLVSVNLAKLAKEGEIEGIDDRKLLFEIARGICNRRETREQQRKEAERMKETLAKVGERQDYLNVQLTDFKKYLQACFLNQYAVGSRKKPAKKKAGAAPAKGQPLLGPFKYKFNKLMKMGVIVDTQVPVSTRKTITFIIMSRELGVFEIVAKLGPAEVGAHRLTMEDLLQKQENNITRIDLDTVIVDTNMILFLLNELTMKTSVTGADIQSEMARETPPGTPVEKDAGDVSKKRDGWSKKDESSKEKGKDEEGSKKEKKSKDDEGSKKEKKAKDDEGSKKERKAKDDEGSKKEKKAKDESGAKKERRPRDESGAKKDKKPRDDDSKRSKDDDAVFKVVSSRRERARSRTKSM